jgi:hypothetical protein
VSTRVIFLEFNELCPPILRHWMDARLLPNFSRFHAQSQVFVAEADAAAGDNLQPWIQWYSLHTGLDLDQHGVRNLTDGPAAGHDDIWSLLARNGIRVANWGSMNARALRVPGSLYLPDPWCQTEVPYPQELSAYQRVVSRFVQENAVAGGASLGPLDYAKFLSLLTRRGLTPETVYAILRQLVNDVALRPEERWKRAVLFDRLQLDLFTHYWQRYQPGFATFFSNSTAHYQHAYWHLAFKGEQNSRLSAEAGRTGQSRAVLYGYQQMDRMLGHFMSSAFENTMLVLCTALSQQASGRTDRVYYRPRDLRKLLRLIGIASTEELPVMAEQCSLVFNTEAELASARCKLEQVRVGEAPIMDFGERREGRLFFGVGLRTQVDADATVNGFEDGRTYRFHDLFHALPHTKSATHHPESALWWRTGQAHVHDTRPSILDIYPTTAELFGVAREQFDPHGVLRGESLLEQLGLRSPARQAPPARSAA